MANKKSGIIFLAVIAFAGLALSGYTFTTNFAAQGNPNTKGLLVVGLWDALDENFETPPYTSYSSFLIEFEDQLILNSDYVSVINNTSFMLPISGIYKISFHALFLGLIETSHYWIRMLRNHTILCYFDRFEVTAAPHETFHTTSASIFVNNSGGDYIYNIQAYGTDTFGITTAQTFNQLSIEYVML